MPRPSGTPVTEHAYISHLNKDKKLQKIISGPLAVRVKQGLPTRGCIKWTTKP